MVTLVAALVLNPCLTPPRSQVPARIWGVTLDNVSNVADEVGALRRLRSRAMARIVFDPGTSPAFYAPAATEIHRVADILGEPIDSAPPSGSMTVDAYRSRMAAFMDALGTRVDVWEIGNEVNGDWTGDSTAMGEKVDAAFQEAKSRHLSTALTLTYSDAYVGKDREMAAWSRKYLPDRVLRGVDYVLVSFYTDTATGPQPDWTAIFGDLGRAFPNAKLGFGELGLRNADFTLSKDDVAKAALVRRYYGMSSPLSGHDRGRFVGGYFWWTFRQDAIGNGDGLWQAFLDVIR